MMDRNLQNKHIWVYFSLLFVIFLGGCSDRTTSLPVIDPEDQIQLAVSTQLAQARLTQTAAITGTPQEPTAAPTATPIVLQNPITATVWQQDPMVAILLYHRYIPIDKTNDSRMKMQLSVFRAQLEQLHAAGFSLVSLEDWLNGKLELLPGKRPLIITFDDLFFADQIYIEEDGEPSLRSGLGVMWHFYQEYPDFGFKPALFSNMGDKYYGNVIRGDWFYVEKGWQDSLAQAIAWCIEHDALVYNHFYTHPSLPKLNATEIIWEMKKNDEEIVKILSRIGKEDLAERSANIISLTFGEWPVSDKGKNAILEYVSPLGKPVLGIVEAEPFYVRENLVLAPYLDGYNPYHIPRIEGQQINIDELIKDKDYLPVAGECELNNPAPENEGDSEYLRIHIAEAVASNRCPAGVYAISGYLFRVDQSSVEQISLPDYPREY
ncbi:MAG: hypothetical protein C0391_00420 [Anaerolinea sp.]|nr:hypothetical protein [Anaerolinea sp.]